MMPKTVTNSKRREQARRLQKRPRRLDKLFDCINCSQSKTVRCKLKLGDRVGSLECEKCKVAFSTSIHHLSHDVDVYHAWIDACEEEQKPCSRSSMASQVQKAQETPQQQRPQEHQRQQEKQRQQEQQRLQEQRKQQEQIESRYATSLSTSRQYQQKKVEYSPQYQRQDISYSSHYQPWEEDGQEGADSRLGARQVNPKIHGYWNQGLGSRGKGAGARRG
ncbi:hypothetical protein BGZ67_010354 [Mortierella alpina]|nr:hypothetical protein BGZ67_010354 [Mortierella alpina]